MGNWYLTNEKFLTKLLCIQEFSQPHSYPDTLGLQTKKYTKDDSLEYNDLNARLTESGQLKRVYVLILVRHITSTGSSQQFWV